MHDLAKRFASDVPAVSMGLNELAAARHLVLDKLGRIVMAHPFSAVPLGFTVIGTQALWRGGPDCAGIAAAATGLQCVGGLCW